MKKTKTKSIIKTGEPLGEPVTTKSKSKISPRQTTLFACVINCDNEDGLETFTLSWCKSGVQELAVLFGCDFWYILHDKDFSSQTGEAEKKHIHLVLRFPTRHTKEAVLNMLGDTFAINLNRISVQGYSISFLQTELRYLIHMDETDVLKNRYLRDDVFTNDKQTYLLAVNNSCEHLDPEYLLDVIRHSGCAMDVIRAIGLDNYSKYRWVIRDIQMGIAEGR